MGPSYGADAAAKVPYSGPGPGIWDLNLVGPDQKARKNVVLNFAMSFCISLACLALPKIVEGLRPEWNWICVLCIFGFVALFLVSWSYYPDPDHRVYVHHACMLSHRVRSGTSNNYTSLSYLLWRRFLAGLSSLSLSSESTD